MPIYEYQCQACHHELEKLQKLSDAPLTDCPQCHEPALKKKISAAAFRLSGSGWYETDFKKEGKKKNLVDSGSSAEKPSAAGKPKETADTSAKGSSDKASKKSSGSSSSEGKTSTSKN